MRKKILIILVAVVALAIVGFGIRGAVGAISSEMSASKVNIEAIRISPELNTDTQMVHMTVEMDLKNESNHELDADLLPYYIVTGSYILPKTDTRVSETSEEDAEPDNLLVLGAGESKTAFYVFDVNMSGSVTLAFPDEVTVTGANPDDVWRTIATTVRDTLNAEVPAPEAPQMRDVQNPSVSAEELDTNQPAEETTQNMPDTVDSQLTQEEAISLTYTVLPQRLGDEVMGGRELTQVAAANGDAERVGVTGHLSPTEDSANQDDSVFVIVYSSATGDVIELRLDDVDLLANP